MSLSIDLKSGQSQQLGHFQNSIKLLLFVMKNLLSSLKMAAECTWDEWIEELKISLTIWMELVMMMIFNIPGRLVA